MKIRTNYKYDPKEDLLVLANFAKDEVVASKRKEDVYIAYLEGMYYNWNELMRFIDVLEKLPKRYVFVIRKDMVNVHRDGGYMPGRSYATSSMNKKELTLQAVADILRIENGSKHWSGEQHGENIHEMDF